MKTLKFLCVILLSACASGLDVKASKSDAIFHLHHFNNKNESKPVKFSLLQQLPLTTSSKQIPSQGNFLTLHLYNQIMVAWTNFFDLLVQM